MKLLDTHCPVLVTPDTDTFLTIPIEASDGKSRGLPTNVLALSRYTVSYSVFEGLPTSRNQALSVNPLSVWPNGT